jgi:two-component system nitrogen regulation response regulator NtrX
MNPDVIILDHQLGKDQEDGLELLRMVKREHPQIPVIYLSGQHDIAPVVQALKLGSIEYIEKNSGALVKLKSVIEELESKKKKKGLGGWF